MPDFTILVGIIFIAGCNYLLTGWFVKYAKKKDITDVPTSRSSHSTPTPRGGGLGFVLISLIAFIIYFSLEDLISSWTYLSMILAFGLIATLGWFDDRINLSQLVRFVVQITASVVVLLFVGGIDSFALPFIPEFSLGFLSPFLGILWITGVTNIYNFMDGVDGIASVQALSATSGWIMFAFFWNDPILLTMNLIVFSTVLVFLVFNWSPAKIFMGDVGSLFLGFFFATMPLLAATGSEERTIASTLWIGVMLLWPFLFDSSSTLFLRFRKGENIFRAHRSHFYQRLNIAGWSHSTITTLYLGFALFCVIIALIYYHEGNFIQLSLLLLLIICSVGYTRWVKKVEREQNVHVTKND